MWLSRAAEATFKFFCAHNLPSTTLNSESPRILMKTNTTTTIKLIRVYQRYRSPFMCGRTIKGEILPVINYLHLNTKLLRGGYHEYLMTLSAKGDVISAAVTRQPSDAHRQGYFHLRRLKFSSMRSFYLGLMRLATTSIGAISNASFNTLLNNYGDGFL